MSSPTAFNNAGAGKKAVHVKVSDLDFIREVTYDCHDRVVKTLA